MPDGSNRVETRECPALATWPALYYEAARVHSRLQQFADYLPASGGLDDQDALLMATLAVLRPEAEMIASAIRQEKSDG
jgi:hypothetical protein